MFLTRKLKNRPGDDFDPPGSYDKLSPSHRIPTHARTTSQTLRGSASRLISAPATNPTLTSDTDLSPLITDRLTREQEQAMPLPGIKRHSFRKSPTTVTDSSTIYSESDESYSHRRSPTSIGETSVSSGSGSPSFSDFGGHHSQGKGPNQQAARPATRATTQSEHMISDPPSQHRHSTQIDNTFHAPRNGVHAGEFYFPRPNDDEVELLFREIKRSFGLGGHLPNMTVDQKWQMVGNAEHLRWSEERRHEQQTKVQGSPEWYIQRFVERTITQKQVSSLGVSLRTNELSSIISQHPLPSVAEEFLAGLSISFRCKVFVCLWKPLYRYQGRPN